MRMSGPRTVITTALRSPSPVIVSVSCETLTVAAYTDAGMPAASDASVRVVTVVGRNADTTNALRRS